MEYYTGQAVTLVHNNLSVLCMITDKKWSLIRNTYIYTLRKYMDSSDIQAYWALGQFIVLSKDGASKNFIDMDSSKDLFKWLSE